MTRFFAPRSVNAAPSTASILDPSAGPDLPSIAARIDLDGIDALSAAELGDLARRAIGVGVHSEVVAEFANPAAPAVARARAFGLIHRRLAAVQTEIGSPAAVAV